MKRFFARSPERRIRDLGRSEIELFLSETAAHPKVSNWQVQQARNALALCCGKFRGIPQEPRDAVTSCRDDDDFHPRTERTPKFELPLDR